MPPKKKQRIIVDKSQKLLPFAPCATPSPPTTTTSSTVPKVRTFQAKWLQLFPWLRYDDKNMTMHCVLCEKTNRQNIFVKGCQNFRKSRLEEHVETFDHKLSLQNRSEQANRVQVHTKLLSEKEKAVKAAVEIAYYIVDEETPLAKFSKLIKLQTRLETPHIEKLKVSKGITYDSTYAFHEFLSAMNTVVEKKIQDDMLKSEVLTVLTDESTDRTNTKRLAILVKTIDSNMTPMTHYLSNVKVSDGKGATMAASVKEELGKRGISNLSKVFGLGTDGATAMTGSDRGLKGQLMRDNPAIVNVHCIAHRLALCTSQASDDVPALKAYVETLKSLFYYFQGSAVRCERMKEIQHILEHDELKFKEVHQVRWLAFYSALEAVNRNLVPLMTYLEDIEVNHRAQDPKAIGLKQKVRKKIMKSIIFF